MSKTLVRKIATKTVCGPTPKQPKSAAWIMTVIGVVNGIQSVSTTFGESCKFMGQFEAVNLATGEVFSSFAMYLPEPATSMLEQAVLQAKEINPTAGIKFAFRIGYQPDTDERNDRGFIYTCEPLLESADNLAEMRKMLPEIKRK